MPILLTMTRLVLSRLNHDPWRHAAGILAIALLLAAFVVLGSLAAGLEQGLSASIEEGRPHDFRVERTPYQGEPATAFERGDLERLRAASGVDVLYPYGYHVTNLTFREGGSPFVGGSSIEVLETGLLVGIDAVAEQDLLVRGPRPEPDGGSPWGGYGLQDSDRYYLEEGRWIEDSGETLVSRTVAENGAPLGSTIEVEHENVTYAFEVVGVIDNGSPGGVVPPGYARTSLGHDYFVVDEQDFPFTTYAAVRLLTEPDYSSMKAVLDELERSYPDTWRTLRYQVLEFERHHFDTVQAVAALAAASQLSGLVGIGTVFGVMLLLLGRETRSLGVLSAVGYPRRALLYYALGKLAILAAAAVPAGIGLGLLFADRMPTPDVAFAFEPAIEVRLLIAQGMRAVGLGVLGAAIAIIMVLRYTPTEAVKTEE